MPGQQNATNARRRIEAAPRRAARRAAAARCCRRLSALANARSAAPAATIEGITFRDGTLDLRISAPDAASSRCHRPAIARGQLAGGHPGRQRQWRHLSRPHAGPQGGCLMRAWYANLAERERRFVNLGAIAAGGPRACWHRFAAESQHRAGAPAGRDQAGRPRLHPERHSRSSQAAGPASAASGPSLVVLIDSSARESGLGKSLSSSQPTGDKRAAHPARTRALRWAGGLAGAALAAARRARGVRGNRVGGRTRPRQRRSRSQGRLNPCASAARCS